MRFCCIWSHFYLNNFYRVILHTETCKKKEKLEKNYLHLYLTIFLNNFLMISSERLAQSHSCSYPVWKQDNSKKNFYVHCVAMILFWHRLNATTPLLHPAQISCFYPWHSCLFTKSCYSKALPISCSKTSSWSWRWRRAFQRAAAS